MIKDGIGTERNVGVNYDRISSERIGRVTNKRIRTEINGGVI